jgi:hypothetical protein
VEIIWKLIAQRSDVRFIAWLGLREFTRSLWKVGPKGSLCTDRTQVLEKTRPKSVLERTVSAGLRHSVADERTKGPQLVLWSVSQLAAEIWDEPEQHRMEARLIIVKRSAVASAKLGKDRE